MLTSVRGYNFLIVPYFILFVKKSIIKFQSISISLIFDFKFLLNAYFRVPFFIYDFPSTLNQLTLKWFTSQNLIIAFSVRLAIFMSRKPVLSSQINPEFKKENPKTSKNKSLIRQPQVQQIAHQDQTSQIKYYEIEEIVDRKTINKVTHYLVKWVGEVQKTWEPISHLIEGMGFIAAFEKQLKMKKKGTRNQTTVQKDQYDQQHYVQANHKQTEFARQENIKIPSKHQILHKQTVVKPQLTLEISDQSQIQQKTPPKLKKQKKAQKVQQKKELPNKQKQQLLRIEKQQTKRLSSYASQTQIASCVTEIPSNAHQKDSCQKFSQKHSFLTQDRRQTVKPTTRRQTKMAQEIKCDSLNVEIDSTFYSNLQPTGVQQVYKSVAKQTLKPAPKINLIQQQPVQSEPDKKPFSQSFQQVRIRKQHEKIAVQPQPNLLVENLIQKKSFRNNSNKKKSNRKQSKSKVQIQRNDLSNINKVEEETKPLDQVPQKNQVQEIDIHDQFGENDKIIRSRSTNVKFPVVVKVQNQDQASTCKSDNKWREKLTLKRIQKIDDECAEVGKKEYLVEYNDEIFTKFTTNQMIQRYPREFAYYLEERCDRILMKR